MKSKRGFLDFFVRYFILIIVGFPNLWLFYLIFAPLTIYPVYFLLNIFFDVSIYRNFISIGQTSIIEIVRACIIGSAYYLLLILNLSTPNIKLKKRISMIFLSFAALLVINIFRIFFLSILFDSKFLYFNLIHEILWYLGSIIFVAAIWFIEVKTFEVKEIPVYSDIKYILKSFKKPKNSKKSK